MVGRRARRRQRKLENPPDVLAIAPPTLIPEAVHTSPHKFGNPNTGKVMRDAPDRAQLKERIIYKVKDKYKSKTNPIVTFKNEEAIDLVNKSCDKRCESLKLQDIKPRDLKLANAILRLNEQAKKLAVEAQAKAGEVLQMGEAAVLIPPFLMSDPVL